MKKSTSVFLILFSIVFFGLMSCEKSPTQKLNKAEEESTMADKKLSDARGEYLQDMENYKNETDAKIAANEQSIKDFKSSVAESKKEAKAEYDAKIRDLEQKNTDMKRKLDEYKMEGEEQWKSFKAEFNHDMDELGNALKDLTVDNKK